MTLPEHVVREWLLDAEESLRLLDSPPFVKGLAERVRDLARDLLGDDRPHRIVLDFATSADGADLSIIDFRIDGQPVEEPGAGLLAAITRLVEVLEIGEQGG